MITSFLFGMFVFGAAGFDPMISGAVTSGAALLANSFQLIPSGVLGVSVCGNISQNIAFNCDDPLQSGTRDRAWIINFEDIDTITYNATNKNIIEDITLKVGKIAYYIDGKNNSIMPSTAMVQQRYANMFDHIVNMKGFDISPAVKDDLNKAKDGRFVVITENTYRGASGNAAFEVYGAKTGLEMTVLTRDPNNADTQGAFDFTFATNLNKEPELPNTFYVTSYSATKTLIEGLLV